MSTTHDLDDLVHAWQRERAEHGRDLPAAELCGDRPELAADLEQRLNVLRRFESLLVPADEAGTLDWSGTPGVEADAPPVPEQYESLGKIGAGGMGVVYKVRHKRLNRVEALKMIRAGELAGPREVARFRFEAEAAAGLEHPNIVTVLGVGEVAGRPYLALRWIDGTSLAERLRGGPLAPREAASLVEKVARAVHYAHQRGILHRDLKPGNILLDQAGEPHVADFGLARRLDADTTTTQAGGVVGTPAYMAPEQARGDHAPTVAVDVWALGVVLFEALTGRLPFQGRTHLELFKQITDAEPPLPRSLNPAIEADLEAVCLKCLEKDPKKRYASAAELADDLERYRLGQAVSAQPPGFWDWLQQMMRTRPEPHPHYSWEVTTAFGFLLLAANLGVFALARLGGSALAVWGVHLAMAAGMGLVLWWFMLRRFRRLPTTERHSLTIAAGHILGDLLLLAAYVPPSAAAPATVALAMYPGLVAGSGLCIFVLGSTNWSRFIPIGLAVMALTPVLAWWPAASPAVYGGVLAAFMWYWSYTKKVYFGCPAT